MTIIEPNKHRAGINKVFWGLVALLFIAAAWSIYTYNETVLLTHELQSQEHTYKEVTASNAELKNERFQITDTKNLHTVAQERGLVKIKNPGYLEVRETPLFANRAL